MQLLIPLSLLLPLLLPTTASYNFFPLVPRGGTFSLHNGPMHLPPNAGPPNQPLTNLTPAPARAKAPSQPHRIKCHGRFELACQQKCSCTPQNTVLCDTHTGADDVHETMRETGHSRELAHMVVNMNMQNMMAVCMPSCYCGLGPFRFTSKEMKDRWLNVQRM
jgi:hypothetical protein